MHQRLQQVDGVGAAGWVSEHHCQQCPAERADRQGIGGGIPAGCHGLRTQVQRTAERDGFEAIGTGIECQIPTGAGSSAGNIAWPAIDATGKAFVIKNNRCGYLAGSWSIIFETNHMADIDLVDRHIAVAISNGQHCFDFATEAKRFVCVAAIRMLKRDVLRNTQRAVTANGYGKCGLANIGAAINTADDQITFDMQTDSEAVCSFQP